jgi:hypothetical protein
VQPLVGTAQKNMSDLDGASGGNRSAIAPGRGSLSTTTANVFAGSSSTAAPAGAVGGPGQPPTGPLLNFNLDSLIDDPNVGGPVAGPGGATRVIRGPDWKWGKQVSAEYDLHRHKLHTMVPSLHPTSFFVTLSYQGVGL